MLLGEQVLLESDLTYFMNIFSASFFRLHSNCFNLWSMFVPLSISFPSPLQPLKLDNFCSLNSNYFLGNEKLKKYMMRHQKAK